MNFNTFSGTPVHDWKNSILTRLYYVAVGNIHKQSLSGSHPVYIGVYIVDFAKPYLVDERLSCCRQNMKKIEIEGFGLSLETNEGVLDLLLKPVPNFDEPVVFVQEDVIGDLPNNLSPSSKTDNSIYSPQPPPSNDLTFPSVPPETCSNCIKLKARLETAEKILEAIINQNTRTEEASRPAVGGGMTLADMKCIDEEDLAHINAVVAEKGEISNEMRLLALRFSGGPPRKFVYNFMRYLMDDGLATKFSLSGKIVQGKKKKRFESLPIYNFLLDLVEDLYPGQFSVPQLREAVGDWLSQAKTRIFRRLTKTKKPMNKCTPK